MRERARQRSVQAEVNPFTWRRRGSGGAAARPSGRSSGEECDRREGGCWPAPRTACRCFMPSAQEAPSGALPFRTRNRGSRICASLASAIARPRVSETGPVNVGVTRLILVHRERVSSPGGSWGRHCPIFGARGWWLHVKRLGGVSPRGCPPLPWVPGRPSRAPCGSVSGAERRTALLYS